jgi:hypothetical protein
MQTRLKSFLKYYGISVLVLLQFLLIYWTGGGIT